ncbi:hypothetical protein PN499_06855 [Kamptonema animale CS-326]|uniref:hypothetical protein n=1 Tax=Kamptonema animale TaxID=92934 RepID=UPI002330411E|nr:hypothetical protein [Kamptonema animale]MDB9510895.1 hypothetical protein [Kamptonema animale CS-326]
MTNFYRVRSLPECDRPFPIKLYQLKRYLPNLEGKRQSRQSGRVVGESRTGKTMGGDS